MRTGLNPGLGKVVHSFTHSTAASGALCAPGAEGTAVGPHHTLPLEVLLLHARPATRLSETVVCQRAVLWGKEGGGRECVGWHSNFKEEGQEKPHRKVMCKHRCEERKEES